MLSWPQITVTFPCQCVMSAHEKEEAEVRSTMRFPFSMSESHASPGVDHWALSAQPPPYESPSRTIPLYYSNFAFVNKHWRHKKRRWALLLNESDLTFNIKRVANTFRCCVLLSLFRGTFLSAEGCFLLTLDPERWSPLNLISWMPLGVPNWAPVIWGEWQAHSHVSMRRFRPRHSEQERRCLKLAFLVCLGCCPFSLSTQPQSGNFLRQSCQVGMELALWDAMLFASFEAHIENLNASPNTTWDQEWYLSGSLSWRSEDGIGPPTQVLTYTAPRLLLNQGYRQQ